MATLYDMTNKYLDKFLRACYLHPLNMILACPLISVFGNAKYLFTAKFSLFSNKMLVFRGGIHKMLVKLANREDPDQTASSEVVLSGSTVFD